MDPAMAGCTEGTGRRNPPAQVPAGFWSGNSCRLCPWTGISLTEAREIWSRAQADFAAVNVQGWTAEILREDLDELSHVEFEPPLVRLLPYFDTFLLGHKERDHLVTMKHRANVYRAQGWIAPVVLVNGRVAVRTSRERIAASRSQFGSLRPSRHYTGRSDPDASSGLKRGYQFGDNGRLSKMGRFPEWYHAQTHCQQLCHIGWLTNGKTSINSLFDYYETERHLHCDE
jgi:hypothetical protein